MPALKLDPVISIFRVVAIPPINWSDGVSIDIVTDVADVVVVVLVDGAVAVALVF